VYLVCRVEGGVVKVECSLGSAVHWGNAVSLSSGAPDTLSIQVTSLPNVLET
jgi:hypothetical protein